MMLLRSPPLKAVAHELDLVLSYATAHADAVILITAGNIGASPVFRPPLSMGITARTKKVRELFQNKAALFPSVRYVDLYREWEDDQFRKDIPRYYAADLFHPSGEGYGLWYGDVRGVLEQVESIEIPH